MARLPSGDAPWPTTEPREAGYRFRGYQLDAKRRPTFRYEGPQFSVTDSPEPQARGEDASYFRRHLTVSAEPSGEGLYFRAGRGGSIEPLPEGGWLIDGALTVRLQGGGTPIVRESAGRQELLVPLDLSTGTIGIVQELDW